MTEPNKPTKTSAPKTEQKIERGDRSQTTTPEKDIPTTRDDVDGEKTDGFKETKRTGYGDS